MVQPAGNAARGGAERLSYQHFKSGAGRVLRWRPDKLTREKVPGEAFGDGALHGLRLGSYCCSPVGGKDDDADVSPGEVLLKDKVLVAGDKGLETGLFGFVQQLPVRDAGPAHLGGGPHVMALQNAAQA